MTIPEGFITTGQAALMLGFKDTKQGKQYLCMVFRCDDTAPKRHGNNNKKLYYKKTDVEHWLKNNDAKSALNHARRVAQGKIAKPVSTTQELRIDFLAGKINHKPKRQRASAGVSI